MEFRTTVTIPTSDWKINHKDTIFLIGSCFSQHIGNRLKTSGFHAVDSPMGIVYNPVSIERQLSNAMEKSTIHPDELVASQGLFVHPDFHSSLSGPDRLETCERINKAMKGAHDALLESRIVFITLGTATGFMWTQRNEVVAHCHRIPSNQFERTLLSVENMTAVLDSRLRKLEELRPDIRIVITVSPVRHTKEGMLINSRSKARLIETAHLLAEKSPSRSYFPAFEWIIDDLRDYRFYADDLIHPSEMAVGYIWEKFKDVFFSDGTKELARQAAAVFQAASHRPLHPVSSAFSLFCEEQLQHIEKLYLECPDIRLETAKDYFRSFQSQI